MGRVVVIVLALGLVAFASVDVDCPGDADSSELVDTTLALPVALELSPSVPTESGERWLTRAVNTGREAQTRIFHPPI